MDKLGQIAIGFVLCAAVMAVYANDKATAGYVTLGHAPDHHLEAFHPTYEPEQRQHDRIGQLIAARPEHVAKPGGMNQQQAEAAYKAAHPGCSTFDIACHLGVEP